MTPNARLSIGALVCAVVLTGTTLHQTTRADGLERRVDQLEQTVAQARAERDTARAEARRATDDLADANARLAAAAERDRAAKVRASRSRRSLIGTPQPSTPESRAWATSPDAVRVANCESADLTHWPYSDGTRYLGGDAGVHLRDPNGHDGKWQFALATWRSVGGTGRAYDATEAEQDWRAWLLWKRDGWWPTWSCARKVGVA